VVVLHVLYYYQYIALVPGGAPRGGRRSLEGLAGIVVAVVDEELERGQRAWAPAPSAL
jgi:hypothetical protein